MGRSGGGAASICPLSAGGFLNPWKRGGMHSSVLPVQTTTFIISETVDIFPNMKSFQSDNLQNQTHFWRLLGELVGWLLGELDGLQLLEQRHDSVGITAACRNAAVANDCSCSGII